jgi:hypothetical protein
VVQLLRNSALAIWGGTKRLSGIDQAALQQKPYNAVGKSCIRWRAWAAGWGTGALMRSGEEEKKGKLDESAKKTAVIQNQYQNGIQHEILT